MSDRWSCNPTLPDRVGTNQLFSLKNQTFLGFKMSQAWSAILMLENILGKNRDIVRIADLGTGCGGLSLFFGLHMAIRSGKVLSIDIRDRQQPGWHEWAIRLGICFEKKNLVASSTIERIRQFIEGGRALIFCDGANKKAEFALFTPLLKPGDLIMAHDWGVEIRDEHLSSHTISQLKPYRQVEFDSLHTQILSMVKI